MTYESKVKEIEITLEGSKLAGLRIDNGKRHRILCVHGWLDNANSFSPLLPLLENAEIVAIDLPGHGYSDHQNALYSVAANSHTVLAAAKALGWNSFTLVGHSLGGCIAPFSTVAAEQMIEKLILIEAAGPRSESADELPDRLKNFHDDMSTPQKYQSRLFDSPEQAVASRLRANKMTPESARLIVERQLEKVQGASEQKWQWRFDKQLRVTSPSYFTEEQVQSVLGAIACPTLCILADDGYLTDRKETNERLDKIADCKVVTLPGHHHLHLDNPQPVADEINRFLI